MLFTSFTRCLLAAAFLPLALADIYMQILDGTTGKNVFSEAFSISAAQQSQSSNLGSLAALNGAVELFDVQFGGANTGATSNNPTTAGKISFSPLSITKRVDQYSPLLLLAMAKSNSRLTVTIGLAKSGNGVPQFYSVYTLTGAALASMSQTVSEIPGNEDLSFVFSAIGLKTAGGNPDGSLKQPNTANWNVITNVGGS